MQQESKFHPPFLSGFVGSTLIHLALLILFLVIPAPKFPEPPLKFEIIENQKSQKTQQVMRDLNLHENSAPQTDDEKLRLLSEKTQRVKQQLQAMVHSDLTKNRSPEPRNAKDQTAQNETPREKELDTNGFEKFIPRKIQPPKVHHSSNDSEQGVSTLSDVLPFDTQIGEITAVDTDHYLFYSYFSRAQELLWNEWAPMVQSILNSPPPSVRASSQNRFTTILEVWFLPTGQLHSVHLLKPSGIPELDYAASTSFKRVGIIPNPPREKIDPDGLIRFKWGLTVLYDPKVLVRQ